jgi:hypothetical protein
MAQVSQGGPDASGVDAFRCPAMIRLSEGEGSMTEREGRICLRRASAALLALLVAHLGFVVAVGLSPGTSVLPGVLALWTPIWLLLAVGAVRVRTGMWLTGSMLLVALCGPYACAGPIGVIRNLMGYDTPPPIVGLAGMVLMIAWVPSTWLVGRAWVRTNRAGAGGPNIPTRLFGLTDAIARSAGRSSRIDPSGEADADER